MTSTWTRRRAAARGQPRGPSACDPTLARRASFGQTDRHTRRLCCTYARRGVLLWQLRVESTSSRSAMAVLSISTYQSLTAFYLSLIIGSLYDLFDTCYGLDTTEGFLALLNFTVYAASTSSCCCTSCTRVAATTRCGDLLMASKNLGKEGRKEGRIVDTKHNVPTALPSTGIRLLRDLLLAI